MLTGLLGAIVIGHLLARTGRGGGRAAVQASAATLGGLAGGAMLLSGDASRWAADLSRTAPAGGSVLDLAVTCAGATLLLIALGLATRHRDGAGALTVAAGLVACLGGMALLDAVAASWAGQLSAGVSTAALGAAVRGGVLAGTGLVLLGAGLRSLCAEHALRRAVVAGALHRVETPAAPRARVAVEAPWELAA